MGAGGDVERKTFPRLFSFGLSTGGKCGTLRAQLLNHMNETTTHPHHEAIRRLYHIREVTAPQQPAPEAVKAHLLSAIQAARDEGYPNFAEALTELYRRSFR